MPDVSGPRFRPQNVHFSVWGSRNEDRRFLGWWLARIECVDSAWKILENWKRGLDCTWCKSSVVNTRLKCLRENVFPPDSFLERALFWNFVADNFSRLASNSSDWCENIKSTISVDIDDFNINVWTFFADNRLLNSEKRIRSRFLCSALPAYSSPIVVWIINPIKYELRLGRSRTNDKQALHIAILDPHCFELSPSHIFVNYRNHPFWVSWWLLHPYKLFLTCWICSEIDK